jgi:hypothetical protein
VPKSGCKNLGKQRRLLRQVLLHLLKKIWADIQNEFSHMIYSAIALYAHVRHCMISLSSSRRAAAAGPPASPPKARAGIQTDCIEKHIPFDDWTVRASWALHDFWQQCQLLPQLLAASPTSTEAQGDTDCNVRCKLDHFH